MILSYFSKKTGLGISCEMFPNNFNPCPAVRTRIYPAFANSVDPDQLASEEAN